MGICFDGHIPDRGDICDFTLTPSKGKEIYKRRPCLVISPSAFNKFTGRCIVIPISNTKRAYSVEVPENDFGVTGHFQADQVYTVDFKARLSYFQGALAGYEISEAVGILVETIDPI